MGFEVIARQIIMLAVIMLLGFIGVKTKYINANLKKGISQVILKFTLPLLNVTAITGQELRPDMLQNAAVIIVIELIILALMFGIGSLVSRLLHLPTATRTIHTLMTMLGNVIFLGYPLITALYGQEGLFYAIVYALVNDIVLWTIGVFLVARSGGGSTKAGLKKLLNPNTVALVAALIMLACGLRLPDILHETLASVGSMTTCLSMLFIGITLADIPLKGIYKRWSVYVNIALKMLLVPAGLALLLAQFPIDRTMLGVLILQIAMPAQSILTVVASDFGSDDRYAAEYVFITTVASLVTLPAVYWFILQII
ncbi:MAG: AEC family transporter [Ruminococcaceae bacterium]|nr:AEC family transporter [Oscillospiraceae bacterium]